MSKPEIPPQLVVDILTAGTELKTIPETIPELDEILSSLSLGQYSSAEIRQFRQDLVEKSQFEILNNKMFNFPYLTALLDRILLVESDHKDAFEVAGIAALYSFLAWFNLYQFQGNLPDIKLLLKALLHVLGSSYSKLIEQSFESAVAIFMILDKHERCYAICDEVIAFAGRVRCPEFVIEFMKHFKSITDPLFFEMIGNFAPAIGRFENYFTGDNLQGVVDFLMTHITQLEPSSLEFLISMGKLGHSVEKLVANFAKSILGILFVGSPIKLPRSTRRAYKLTSGSHHSADAYCPCETDFDPSSRLEIPELIDLDDLIQRDVLEKLKLLVRFFVVNIEHAESLIRSFLYDMGLHSDTEYFSSIFLVMIYFCHEFMHYRDVEFRLSTPIAMQFYAPQVFDPSITLYERIENFEVLNTLRYHALEILLNDSGAALDALLSQQLYQWPLLLAEVMERMIDLIDILKEKFDSHPHLIDTFAVLLMQYQQFDETVDVPIGTARLTLFHFYAHLFCDSDVVVKFLSNSVFCCAFMGFLKEKQFTEFIISMIREYLMSADPDVMEKTSDIIVDMFNIMMERIDKPILLMALKSMNNALSYRHDIGHLYAVMCEKMIATLPLLGKDEESMGIVGECIHFFAMTSQWYSISNEQVDTIVASLNSFGNDQFVSSLYSRFVQLLAGKCLPNIAPTFIIKQPQIFKLFIRVLFNSPRLVGTINFFYELCRFSPMNINACATSELDMFILWIFEKEREKESISMEAADMLLGLFRILSIRRSTAQTAYKFLSLLSHSPDGTVSKYQPLFIETLKSLATESAKQPSSALQLNGNVLEKKVRRDGIETISEGWTFVFWIYLEPTSTDYIPFVCQLYFGRTAEFHVYLNMGCLFFVQDDGVSTSVAKVSDVIGPHEWHFVTVTFLVDGPKSWVMSSMDLQSAVTMNMSPLAHPLDLSNVRFLFDSSPTPKVTIPARIACAGVFPCLSGENIISVYETGLRVNTKTLPVEPYCYVRDFGKYSDVMTTGIVDVLGKQCGLQAMIPIFLQKNMHFRDKTPYNFTMEEGIQLVGALLSLSRKSQQLFYEQNGFKALRQVIEEVWIDEFKLKTYLQLFQCLQQISYEDLQKQLFREILGSFRLLLKLDENLQLRIIKHWNQSLVKSLGIATARELWSFDVILIAIRKFYSAPAQKQCRTYFFSILMSYVECDGFGEDDFMCLLNHSLNCPDLGLTGELIGTFTDIISIPNSVKFSLENKHLAFMVNFFLQNPFEHIQIAALDILMCCYRLGLLKPTWIFDLMFTISMDFPTTSMNKNVFNYMLNSVAENPYFLSFVAFMAHTMDGNEAALFCEDIEPSAAFVLNDYWAFWPLMLWEKASESDEMDCILDFLVRCGSDSWSSLFSQVIIVFGQKPSLFTNVSSKLISLMQSHTTEYSAQFFDICKHVIFYETTNISPQQSSVTRARRGSFDIRALRQTTPVKPSRMSNVGSFSPPRQRRRLSYTSLYMFDCIQEGFEFEFAIKRNEKGEWRHMNLALQCMEMFSHYGNIHDIFFILVLCGFLQCTEFDSVSGYLRALDLKESEVEGCEIAIELIQYHTVLSNREQFFELNGKPLCSPLTSEAKYFEFLEKIRPVKLHNTCRQTFQSFQQAMNKMTQESYNLGELSVTNYAKPVAVAEKIFEKSMKCNESMEWRQLWCALSRENAPWHLAYVEQKRTRFRSDCYCVAGVPVRMTTSVEHNHANKWFEGEMIAEWRATRVELGRITEGMFRIFKGGIVFNTLRLPHADICAIFLRKAGFELFTKSSRAYLFHLSDENTRNAISVIEKRQPNLKVCQKTNNEELLREMQFTEEWRSCNISNYEYIMILNRFSGRSFNDINNYPIFPWIITDFETPIEKVEIQDFKTNVKEATPSSADVARYLANISPGKQEPVLSMDSLFAATSSELSPEYYSMPEVFSPGFKLPEWAKSPLDFIYRHRKLLETPDMSVHLPRWFARFSLFSGPHPQRRVAMADPELMTVIRHSLHIGYISCSDIVKPGPQSVTVAVVQLDGKYSEFTFDFKKDRSPRSPKSSSAADLQRQMNDAKIPIKADLRFPLYLSRNKYKIREFSKQSTICAIGSHMFALLELGKLWIIDSNGKEVTVKLPRGGNCMAGDAPWIVVGNEDSEVAIVRDLEFHKSAKLYQKEVTCVACSNSFKMFVAGTRNAIAICDLVSGEVCEVIKLANSPMKVLITPFWGFVVVYCEGAKNTITVFTVNGDFVAKREISTEVYQWYSFASSKGFDYLIYADKTGKLYACEVYYIAEGEKQFYDCGDLVSGFDFNSQTMTCTVVTEKGDVAFIPLSITNV